MLITIKTSVAIIFLAATSAVSAGAGYVGAKLTAFANTSVACPAPAQQPHAAWPLANGPKIPLNSGKQF